MALRTGLIVEVPEAEPVVGPYRLRLDAQAPLGVPAHVTVLFPLAPPDLVDDAMLARIADLAAGVAPFEHQLVRTDWFGSDVLWLGSDADKRFRELIRLFADAFPDYPPYGGQFDEPVPHLTIGDRAPIDELRAAEAAIRPALPIRSLARAVTLMMQQRSGHWTRARTFAFGS